MPRGRDLLLIAAAAGLAVLPVVAKAAAAADRPAAPAKPATPATAGGDVTATPDRFAAADIVDVPVRFGVRNINRSAAACTVDGKPYTISGHLTAPAAVLARPDRSVTLYEHGIAAGEWYWRVNIPGYDHVEELAKRGHASLTIDRLGYDASGKPDGTQMCIGGEADIAHQIVQQLRAGTYQVLGRDARATPGGKPASFRRVVLAGQSNGGQIVQIEAYSFRDVDGLVIMDWTDRGLTQQANARFFTSLQNCLNGGSPAGAPTDPSGYVYYDLGREEFRTGNFHDTEQRVLDAALPFQNRHPCGDMVSQLGGVFADLRHLGEIRLPVLFLYGEKDARVQGGEAQRALYTGTRDTELLTVPEAGHYMGLARNARQVHDRMASWLDRHHL